jgi:hypothetical protein
MRWKSEALHDGACALLIDRTKWPVFRGLEKHTDGLMWLDTPTAEMCLCFERAGVFMPPPIFSEEF